MILYDFVFNYTTIKNEIRKNITGKKYFVNIQVVRCQVEGKFLLVVTVPWDPGLSDLYDGFCNLIT